MVIRRYSSSTLFSYGRAIDKVSLYWGKTLLELQPEQVNEFLYAQAEGKKVKAYFGLEKWVRQDHKWEDIACEKLNAVKKC